MAGFARPTQVESVYKNKKCGAKDAKLLHNITRRFAKIHFILRGCEKRFQS
jgi:hypothetical protein